MSDRIIRGSYANGFAPNGVKPAYPQFWDAAGASWCPSLGQTGMLVLDTRQRQQVNGTLTNLTMTGWENVDGQLALRGNGTTGYVSFGSRFGNFGTKPFTIHLWVKGGAIGEDILMKDTAAGTGNGVYIYCRGISAAPYAYWNGSSAYEFGANDGNGHFLTVVRYGAATNQLVLYYDGMPVVTGTESRTLSNATNLSLMKGTGAAFRGVVDDVHMICRALSPSEVKLLCSRRGIAYEWIRRTISIGSSTRPLLLRRRREVLA